MISQSTSKSETPITPKILPLTLNLGDRVESLAPYLLASGPFNKTLFLKVDATLFVSIHVGQLSLAQNINKYIPILIISKYNSRTELIVL